MTCATPAIPSTNPAGLLDALRRGDHTTAGALLDETPLDLAQLQSIGDGLMRRRRWADAEWVLSRVPEPRPAAVEMKRLLARNFAALHAHRPEVYQQLITLGATDAFGVANSPSGRPTILARRADGSAVTLSGGADPLASAHESLRQIRAATPNGEAVALCGLGDGYLLQLLALNPPELFMDMQQAVFVLEPQPQVLLHALMIHDLAGPGGPIAAERFRLFVGPNWRPQLDAAITRQPSIGLSNVLIQQGLHGATVAAGVREGIQALAARDKELKREVEAYYAGFTPDFARGDRKPRVMLVTTRFSTVLQYATRDTAEAFEQLGWDTLVLVEPAPSHRLYQFSMRASLAEFKPDLVFQIDHLRHEHGEMFPPRLPFVCWIQDHLPQLKTPKAAQSVTATEFVLTDAGGVYSSTFGYPRRQLIGLNKLTRVPATVRPVERFEDDIVFVSNASYVAEDLVRERAAGYDGSAAGRALLSAAGERIIACYRAGGCIDTWIDLLALVRNVAAARSLDMPQRELESVAAWLFHPLNDALYRQQALAWAADAARETGLSFALYGKGWEKNPRFVNHARGPLAYGADLERVTRTARINLQVVPYLCLHQRLLDGLAAGGFYLIRSHPADTAVGALLDFVRAHAGTAAGTLAAARAAMPPDHLEELDRLTAAAYPAVGTGEADDPVEIAAQWEQTCLVRAGEAVLPGFGQSSFTDAASFRQCLGRFVADADARERVRAAQRSSVVERFSYGSGIRRVMQQVQARLQERRPLVPSPGTPGER